MQPHFDPNAPTLPASQPLVATPGAAPPQPQPPSEPAPEQRMRRALLAVACATAALIGMLIGILIGRAGGEDDPTPPQQATGSGVEYAQLTVTSKPVDANVLVNGRFVGVSPVARIDLDPGKHSIVIDSFGYQPYAGTLEVEPAGRASLKVVLAPVGGAGTTNGELVADGTHKNKATNTVVPATALAPVTLTGTGTSKDTAKKPPKPSGGGYRGGGSYTSPPPAPSYQPPPRPRRDCSGEKSQCRDSCSRANGDCRFNCPHCVGCPSSVGSEECKRQCDTCRAGCEQNVKFCESSCDSNYNSCQASNN